MVPAGFNDLFGVLMNTRGLAYVNHGRWIVDCPECGSPIRFEPKDGTLVYCGVCNPGIMATAFARRTDRYGRELFDRVPDHEKREEARRNAKPFKVTVPRNWQKIFETLRKRHVSFMNWLPGETLADLIAENVRHGLEKI